MQSWYYPITPVGKPRQTRFTDRKNRALVKYRAFRDQVRLRGVQIPDSALVVFLMPMPASWSQTKKLGTLYTPHRSKPDVDNMLKALMDSVLKDDRHIWDIHPVKIWAAAGGIVVSERNPFRMSDINIKLVG
jgi:Holliday junction resolvase RusA-like endonuclease